MSTKTSGTEVSNGKKELIADADPGSLSRAQEDVYEFALAGDRHVNVRNTSYDETGHVYTVAVEDGLPARCTCPAFEHHDGPCKHLLACVIRSPIMTALGSASESQRVAADGGTEVSASPEQPSPPLEALGGETVHDPLGTRQARRRDLCPMYWLFSGDHPCGSVRQTIPRRRLSRRRGGRVMPPQSLSERSREGQLRMGGSIHLCKSRRTVNPNIPTPGGNLTSEGVGVCQTAVATNRARLADTKHKTATESTSSVTISYAHDVIPRTNETASETDNTARGRPPNNTQLTPTDPHRTTATSIISRSDS